MVWRSTMQRLVFAVLVSGLISLAACGSDDDDGGGTGGSGGGGGTQGTTCADGYPKVGTPCAIAYEKCTSCGTYACCDIFECLAGVWAQTQFHTLCPSDGGADVADAANEASPDGD